MHKPSVILRSTDWLWIDCLGDSFFFLMQITTSKILIGLTCKRNILTSVGQILTHRRQAKKKKKKGRKAIDQTDVALTKRCHSRTLHLTSGRWLTTGDIILESSSSSDTQKAFTIHDGAYFPKSTWSSGAPRAAINQKCIMQNKAVG